MQRIYKKEESKINRKVKAQRNETKREKNKSKENVGRKMTAMMEVKGRDGEV